MNSDDKKKELEFRRMVGLNLSLLKLCGVIPIGNGFGDILAYVAFTCLTVFSVSYTYEFVTSINDPATVLESFALIISFVGGQARFMILFWFRDNCRKMFTTCEFLWSTLIIQEKEIVQSYVDTAKRLTRWYLISCAITIFFYVVFALFGGLIFAQPAGNSSDRVSEDLSYERQLPYAFFLDVEESPWYEIVYAFQLVSIINVGFICVGVDMVGPLLILVACGHFDAIRFGIGGLETIVGSSASGSVKNLRIYVIRHQVLLDFCKNIERMTNMIFFTQLFGSTYNISLVGFKLIEDNPDKYKYITQLLIGVIQLFLCNWPPDLLLEKTEAIARAAYTVPWYQYPRNLGKMTNIFIVKSQKPVRLTAGKFVGLSLETFASMISTAASFFTVVRNMS